MGGDELLEHGWVLYAGDPRTRTAKRGTITL